MDDGPLGTVASFVSSPSVPPRQNQEVPFEDDMTNQSFLEDEVNDLTTRMNNLTDTLNVKWSNMEDQMTKMMQAVMKQNAQANVGAHPIPDGHPSANVSIPAHYDHHGDSSL
eukprot:scaffold15422_cov39-Cylindrotheca_fusiformis.AAC.2